MKHERFERLAREAEALQAWATQPNAQDAQDLIAVECRVQREKEEAMNEKPIVIESDFISHVDGQPCRDRSCPCRGDFSVLVNLSEHVEAEYDRIDRSLVLWRGTSVLAVLSPEETYRLLALLHAEMPASHE